jgi:hypothetical protein
MPDQPYSNRELDSKFAGLAGKIDASKDTMLDHMTDFQTSTSASLQEIKAQTTKTNGRVTSLEDELVRQQLWRAYITGALAVLTFFLAMVFIPIVAAYIQAGRF